MDSSCVSLIDTLYEASINQGALDKFVQELSQITDSSIGGIFSRDDNTAQSGFLSSYGTPAEKLTAFEQSSQFHREFCRHLSPQPGPGRISYTQDTLPGDRLHSSSIYNAF